MVLPLSRLMRDSKSGLYEGIISLTNRCNLRCSFCYVRAGDYKFQDLSLNDIKRIFIELKNLDVQAVTLTGGEPLLHPRFFDIASLAKKYFPVVFLASNGFFIDKSTALKLKKLKISNVQISIEGRKGTHSKIRGNSHSYIRAINAVKNLRELGVDVTLSPTMTKNNLKDFEYLVKLAEKLNCDLSLKRQISVGRAESKTEISPFQYKRLYEFSTKYNNKGIIRIFMHCDPLRTTFGPIRRDIVAGCIAGFGLIYIKYDGEIYPCSKLPISLGNINSVRISNAIKSPLVDLLKNRRLLKGKCNSCDYNLICGGCRAAAYGRYKDVFAQDPLCWK